MVALEVHGEQLLAVARQLTSAAGALSAAAAAPLAHPPVAADEVSTSAAARLTGHGAILSSRAQDGAAVLAAAAAAITQAAGIYEAMNQANAQTVSLHRNPGAPAPAAFTPAATMNAPTPVVPIAPVVPRDGKSTAALMESGNASAGSGFVSGCRQYAQAFDSAHQAARSAEAAVRAALTGQAGTRIAAALNRFGTWADSMSTHAETVRAAGQEHADRFSITQQKTPRTAEFTQTEKQINIATQLNTRPGTIGMYTGTIATLKSKLAGLHAKAGGSMMSYHLGELPAAPPGPPPVTPIVAGGHEGAASARPGTDAGSQDPRAASRPGIGQSGASTAGTELRGPADESVGAGADLGEELGIGADGSLEGFGDVAGAGMPGGGDQMTQMVGMLPGVLGGILGAAAAIPAALAGQAQQAVSQVVEGVSGAAKEMNKPDLDASLGDTGLSGLGTDLGTGSGSGGGGGGDTEPAGATGALPPGGTDMMSMSGGTTAAPVPLAAASSAAGAGTAMAPGPAGAPMMGGMPMGGGMGGGGGAGVKPVKEADKKVYIPDVPNSEPVRGEASTRRSFAATAEDVVGAAVAAPPPEQAFTVTSARRGAVTDIKGED